jgi:hypothetical protein
LSVESSFRFGFPVAMSKSCKHATPSQPLRPPATIVCPTGESNNLRMPVHSTSSERRYAIPWSLLNAADDPPRAGDTLACTWLTHWSDPTGQNWRGQMIEIVNPKEQGWNFQNAGTWGRAIYEPAASTK